MLRRATVRSLFGGILHHWLYWQVTEAVNPSIVAGMFGKRGSGSRIPPHTLRAALPAALGFSSRVFGPGASSRRCLRLANHISSNLVRSGNSTSRCQKALTKRASPPELLTKRSRHSPVRVQARSGRRLHEAFRREPKNGWYKNRR